MAKFWKMAVAFFAMMSMVVVPVSCGDDDDDKGGSSNGLGGKIYDLRPDHSISYSDIYHEEELKIIRFFNNGNYELYEPYCIVINYKVDEQNLELRVSKKGSYSFDGSQLLLFDEKGNLDEEEDDEFIISKNGNTYDMWYSGFKCNEISDSELNKLQEEFKKEHTH